jgi:hypothetical protein
MEDQRLLGGLVGAGTPGAAIALIEAGPLH